MLSFSAGPGNKSTIKTLTELETYTTRGLRSALFDIGFKNARDAGDLINNESRSGRVYFVKGTPHQSSAPGEAPANMSGRLKKSMNYLVRGYHEVEFGSTARHALWLEEGTKLIQPRPFLIKVATFRQTEAISTIEKMVHDEIKRRR